MRLCLCSNAKPWFFGPYGEQFKYLCEEFLNKYDLYYLLLNKSVPSHSYSYLSHVDEKTETLNDKDKALFSKIKFISGVQILNQSILISDLNKILVNNGIDKILFLSDLTRLCFDEPFAISSFVWYPNHFSPINHENRKKLELFDCIISLCETDEKQLRDIFPDKSISMVPHIINITKPTVDWDKNQLRTKYSFKKDNFILFMNVGNYDFQNRKSLDTALFAFEKFVSQHPESILFIHTYDVRKIDINNHYTPKNGFFEFDDILSYLKIPSQNIRIIDSVIERDILVEYYLLADVYLQTSKSEGFGLPVLEAQKLGIPVITTDFGAMSDYTYNGVKVKPCQRLYDQSVRGIWCMPSIDGVFEAMQKVYYGNYENNRDYAIQKITETMSKKNVARSIENIFKLYKPKYKIPTKKGVLKEQLQIIYYDEENYIMDKKKYAAIEPSDINNSEWIMLVSKDALVYDKNLCKLSKICNEYDIIAFTTKYKNAVYPNEEAITRLDKPDKINYLIKSRIAKTLIDKNILVPYMKGFILLHSMHLNKKFITDTFCIQNTNI